MGLRRAANRRVASGRRPASRKGQGRSTAGGRTRGKSTKSANRRVNRKSSGRSEEVRKPADPMERKIRNRTVLLLVALAVVNIYMFFGRGASMSSLGLQSAAIAAEQAEHERGFAIAPDNACGGDPVRIFEGLENLIHVDTKLSEGSTLRLALLRLGVGGDEIDEIEAGLGSRIDLGLLAGSGAPVRAATDRDGAVLALEIEVAEGQLVQACRRPVEGTAADGGPSHTLDVRNIQHPLRTEVAVVAVQVPRDTDLVAGLRGVNEKPELASKISAVLAHDLDLMSEIMPGDEIQLLVEKRYLGRHFHRYGAILAVRYIGEGARVAFFHYKVPGREGDYFDRDGEPMVRALLRSPLAWLPTDPSARASLAPKIEFLDGRMGAVYRRPKGAPVVALADGVVSDLGLRGDDGLVLELKLHDGSLVRYANLMRIMGDIEVGQTLSQGQLVALVGQSGKTPRSRLRMELVGPDGVVADPMVILSRGQERPPRVGETIPDNLTERFDKDVQPWHRAMRQAAH